MFYSVINQARTQSLKKLYNWEIVEKISSNLFAARYKKHFEINMRDNSNQSASQEDAFTHKEF